MHKLTYDAGNKVFVAADEDEIDEDLVEVDNEGDTDENEGAMTGDDVESDEFSESTKSPDADTQLLFVKPLYTSGSQLELP